MLFNERKCGHVRLFQNVEFVDPFPYSINESTPTVITSKTLEWLYQRIFPDQDSAIIWKPCPEMELHLKKLVFAIIGTIYWICYAEDPTTCFSFLHSKNDSIWLSTEAKGLHHKWILSRPHVPSCLSVDHCGHRGEIILLLLLSGNIEVHVNLGPVTCPICDDLIQQARRNKKGQDVILCGGSCQAWIHRQCASLTKCVFEKLADTSMDFFCHTCRLAPLESERCDLRNQFRSLQEMISKYVNMEPCSNSTQLESHNQQVSYACAVMNKSSSGVKGNGPQISVAPMSRYSICICRYFVYRYSSKSTSFPVWNQ